MTQNQPRAWQRMLSGRRLDLLNPHPDDIEIEDIAHGLARMARWNGQTLGQHAYTVAQHVVFVERIADLEKPDWTRQWRLAALLHDAAEYVIGDLISPFKNAIGLDYKTFENNLMTAVHTRFGLPNTLPGEIKSQIKRADRIAAYFEATELAGFSPDEAEAFFHVHNKPALQQEFKQNLIVPWPAATAQQHFLARFRELTE